MAELYWIRLPEHTDMWTQGYVGITKHTASRRFRSHKKDAKRKDRPSTLPIHRAIRKYEDLLIVDTLCVADIEYVAELEGKLRPAIKIGWNLDVGGSKGKVIGNKHSAESIALMSKKRLALYQDAEYKEKRADMTLSKFKPDYNFLDEEGYPHKFWQLKKGKNFYPKGAKPLLWFNIPELWYFYTSNPKASAIDAVRCSNFYTKKNLQWVRKIISYFRSGWNPLEDELYLEDFKIGN